MEVEPSRQGERGGSEGKRLGSRAPDHYVLRSWTAFGEKVRDPLQDWKEIGLATGRQKKRGYGEHVVKKHPTSRISSNVARRRNRGQRRGGGGGGRENTEAGAGGG